MARARVTGALEEVIVAAELGRRGFDVFTPIVGHSASCDLVAVCPTTHIVLRVEVKRCVFTAERADGSGQMFANAPSPSQRPKHDVVAYVLVRDASRVVFVPELDGEVSP